MLLIEANKHDVIRQQTQKKPIKPLLDCFVSLLAKRLVYINCVGFGARAFELAIISVAQQRKDLLVAEYYYFKILKQVLSFSLTHDYLN